MIFGIGLPKTATSSLWKSMQLLGYNSRHYLTEHEYQEVLKRNAQKYQFLNDLPFSIRYKELDSHFPNSKFIYTDRDIDQWITSCSHHWQKVGHITKSSWPDYRREAFGMLGFDEQLFRTVYFEHKQCIMEYFKDRPNDLLVMNIPNGDGWDKLCPFLEQSIIDQPFPFNNARVG